LMSPETSDGRDGTVILQPDASGRPERGAIDGNVGDVLRAWIPADAVALRQRDPDGGRAWRWALRDTFGTALQDGYRATAIDRDGWYTLVRDTSNGRNRS